METIRIQSDGTPLNTVITLADGTQLEGVVAATIYLDRNEVNRASLDIVAPTHDIHAVPETVYIICPCCQESISHECRRTL